MKKFLLSLLVVSSLLRADFLPQHWQFRQAIEVSSAASLCRITLNSAVYSHSRVQLHDLRVLRGGSEVPYELYVSAESRQEEELPLTILDKAIVPGQGLQAVLDLNGHPPHNRLRIATTQRNFKESIRIETSDDARHWALARADALLFDISRPDRSVADLTADYPLSTRRFIRLTIQGWTNPSFLRYAWLSQVSETSAIRDNIAALKPIVTQDPEKRTTSYIVDIGFNGQPYDQLALSVGPELFLRNIDVFTSHNEKNWVLAGAGVMSNRPGSIHLELQFPEQWSRYLKLVIGNGDSPPVIVHNVAIRALRRTVNFLGTRPGSYWLYSGNADASAPQYDLSQIASATAAPVPVLLSSPKTNPEYKERSLPVPWSERSRYLLTAIVIAAAAIMAYITLRLLVRVQTN